MTRKPVVGGIAALGVALLGGCGGSTTRLEPQAFGDNQSVATTADMRLVIARPGALVAGGRPATVVCAEPSPDVARAISDALAANLDAEVQGIKAAGLTGGIDTALSASRGRAESIAQLGKRLGTIQLLRDGLYRACEAYANGAITATSYALMLSRYGDTMVSLLAAEVAGGENAAPPAVILGSVKVTGAEAPQSSAGGSAQAPQGGKPAPAPQVAIAIDGKAPTAAGGSSPTPNSDPLNAVVAIQRAYLAGSSYAPLITACATAMDREGAETPFVAFCRDHMPAILTALMQQARDIAAAQPSVVAKPPPAARPPRK